MNLKELIGYHQQRLSENILPGCDWTPERWVAKLSEENGEYAKAIVKEEGSESELNELCDILHTAICVALTRKFTPEQIIRNLAKKFNRTSSEKGSKIFIKTCSCDRPGCDYALSHGDYEI